VKGKASTVSDDSTGVAKPNPTSAETVCENGQKRTEENININK